MPESTPYPGGCDPSNAKSPNDTNSARNTSCSHHAIDADDVAPLLALAGRQLCAVRPGSAAEEAVVRFIQTRFFDAYGARPQLRIPQLLALLGRQREVSAAVGVREAAKERLFLEDYIDAPIEHILPDEASIARSGVFEIAHLAGVEPGISRFLFPMLTLWLTERNASWIAFTGTAQLRNSFDRLGIEIRVIAPALATRLPDQGRGWGRYYDHGPMVMVASVPSGYAALMQIGLLRHIEPLVNGGRYGLTA